MSGCRKEKRGKKEKNTVTAAKTTNELMEEDCLNDNSFSFPSTALESPEEVKKPLPFPLEI